jgi:hypothetical protein
MKTVSRRNMLQLRYYHQKFVYSYNDNFRILNICFATRVINAFKSERLHEGATLNSICINPSNRCESGIEYKQIYYTHTTERSTQKYIASLQSYSLWNFLLSPLLLPNSYV